MSQVSRPMQVLLIATVLFAALWFVALRPKSAASGGGAPAPAAQAPDAPGVQGLTTAIDKAHGAVATQQADANRAGATSADGSSSDTASGAAGQTGTDAASPAKRAAPARQGDETHAARLSRADAARLRALRAALHRHEAVAVAFVNPSVADARAVAVEIRHVSHFDGRALTLVVPISQLSRYDVITREVQVTVAPTTVIVAPTGKATTIVGFADRVEIQQRLADALAKKR